MRDKGSQLGQLAAGLVALLMAFMCALSPGVAHAEQGSRTDLRGCVARAEPGVPVTRAFDPGVHFDCTTRQTAFGRGDYWVRFEGVGRAPREALSLRMASLWQGAITVAVRYADGTVLSQRYTSETLPQRLKIGAIVSFPIVDQGTPPVAIIAHVEDAANLRGIVVAPRLETHERVASTALWMTALYAAFFGLAFALLVYNFVLWLTLRYPFQLHYCLMIAATMAYTFTSSAAYNIVFPALANNDRLRINYILLALTASAAVAFMMAFFERGVIGPRLRLAIRLSIGLMMGTGLAFALFAPDAIGVLDRAYFSSFLFTIALMPALAASAWRARSRYLGMFLLAWSAPIIVSLLRALYGFGILPYSFWLDNGTVVSMSIESLLNSLAIAYRIKLLVEERDHEKAQKAVAVALAQTDPLTGLDNRRAFLAAAIGRAGPQRLMLVDIDHFKRINDTLGHDTGDDVLRTFALALRKWVPEDALVARLGGEEFGLLVNARDIAPAESVLATIRAQAMPTGCRITASIGVAEGPLATEEDWRVLYRRADAALYRAKADGRDRACVTTALPQAA